MNKKRFLVFIAACLIAVAVYANLPVTAVVLYDDMGMEKYRFLPLDGRFTIRFLHSWAHSPVDEVFQIDAKNNIVLKETFYEDFGAGLPHEPEHPLSSMTVENGKIHIRDINRIISDLQVRTGRYIAAHTLIYRDRHVSFSDFASPGDAVIFKTQSVKRYVLWLTVQDFNYTRAPPHPPTLSENHGPGHLLLWDGS